MRKVDFSLSSPGFHWVETYGERTLVFIEEGGVQNGIFVRENIGRCLVLSH